MNRTIGIDVSKNTLDVAFEEHGQQHHQVFPNAEHGFHQLLKWTKQRGRKLIFCMEATGAYSTDLADFLYERGFCVYIENAKLIKAFRESENERNSTDKLNAFSIARYASAHLQKLRTWKPLPVPVRRLRELTRVREALVQSKTEWTNRRKSAAMRSCTEHVENMLKCIQSSIKAIEKELRELVKTNSGLKTDVSLLRSIRGIGFITACVILAEVPWIREFESKSELIAYAGLNPALRKSGTSIDYKPRLSKIGNARLRKALYMPAVVALRHNERVKEFAERMSVNGKHSLCIIGAVMRRLLCYVFGVLRTGEPHWREAQQGARKQVA